jgi:hypothetical protein
VGKKLYFCTDAVEVLIFLGYGAMSLEGLCLKFEIVYWSSNVGHRSAISQKKEAPMLAIWFFRTLALPDITS